MPARGHFFKRAEIGRSSGANGCLAVVLRALRGLIMRAFYGKDLTTMSILTSYRPNFCCECGNKIVRLRWFIWTSRRFCDKCFRTFGRSHWLRPSITVLVFFLAAFILGHGCRRAPPPLIIERPINFAAKPGATSGTTSGEISGAPNSPASQPSPVTEQTYICGARTRKGTPCSRRVHGPTRCWQHKGAPAMQPQEKLLVKE